MAHPLCVFHTEPQGFVVAEEVGRNGHLIYLYIILLFFGLCALPRSFALLHLRAE